MTPEVALDGAWSEPRKPTQVAVLHLHGKGGNFYSGPGKFLPPLLPDVAHLSINMRCHDLGYTQPGGYWEGWPSAAAVGGGMWEDLAAGDEDVAAGLRWLRSRGFDRIVLAGHSSGGFYAGVQAAMDADLAGLVFLSPLMSNRNPLPQWFPEPGRMEEVQAHAERLVVTGRGHHLIPLPVWYFAISARSLLQRLAEPPGHWSSCVERAAVPSLLIYGTSESGAAGWERLAAQAPDGWMCHTIDTADHYYGGHEAEVAEAVWEYLEKGIS